MQQWEPVIALAAACRGDTEAAAQLVTTAASQVIDALTSEQALRVLGDVADHETPLPDPASSVPSTPPSPGPHCRRH